MKRFTQNDDVVLEKFAKEYNTICLILGRYGNITINYSDSIASFAKRHGYTKRQHNLAKAQCWLTPDNKHRLLLGKYAENTLFITAEMRD